MLVMYKVINIIRIAEIKKMQNIQFQLLSNWHPDMNKYEDNTRN